MPRLSANDYMCIKRTFARCFEELFYQAAKDIVVKDAREKMIKDAVFYSLIAFIAADVKINSEEEIRQYLFSFLSNYTTAHVNNSYMNELLLFMYESAYKKNIPVYFIEETSADQLKIKQVIYLLCIQNLTIEQTAIMAYIPGREVRIYLNKAKNLLAKLVADLFSNSANLLMKNFA